MNNFKRLAVVTLFAILVSACGSQPSNKHSGPIIPKTATQDIAKYLAQAQTAPPTQAAQLKLQAAQLMLLQQKYNDALNTLNSVATTDLDNTLKLQVATTKAKAALGLNNALSAIQYLTSEITEEGISSTALRDKYATLANAYALNNQFSKELTARISESQYINNTNELLNSNEVIWQLFKTVDLAQLKSLENNDNSYTLRGWLALQIAFKETINNEKLVANEWYKKWTSHTAAKFQPLELANYLSIEPLRNTSYAYQHVVVALPKSGKYAKGASAILKGIKLAAKSPTNRQYQISYIDSAIYNSAESILHQAMLINADAVIGPLDKDIVAQFAQMPELPIPVLALNTTSISNSNLYQFSLSNEDEVRDAAVRAYQDGRRNVLSLVPAGEQGELAATIFANTFNALGGNVLTTSVYNTSEGSVTAPIAKMLKLNPSRIRGLQRRVKTAQLRNSIRRMIRKDADAIFLFANKSDAYQIGPSLLYFYADNIPLYATSKIHRGTTDPVKDIDLNGMMFGDLPWVLTPSKNKAILANSVNNTQTRFGRLYAFGIDALNLAPRLYNLSTQPSASFTGETGKLSISANNFVEKTLTWAKFENGELTLLPAQQ